jgi:hypothetical protein
MLRIGDYIQYLGENCKVVGFSATMVFLKRPNGGRGQIALAVAEKLVADQLVASLVA